LSDNELTAEQVDQQIAARVEQLKSQAVTPAVEPVDEEAACREEEGRREKRRAENLRRMKAPVLVQRTESGFVFKHDPGIRDDARRVAGQN
jgi:hypothetical protein